MSEQMPMTLIVAPGEWRVAGHDRAVHNLASALAEPAHAHLFVGPKRIGKRTLAVELAKALNCEAEQAARPCQICFSCRLIEKAGHPDVTLIEPDDKAHVSIDQVRSLRQELAMPPTQARWRVVTIRADTLTEPAADALLKTLEEPNSRVVLILTTFDLDAVPETIVSRCQTTVLGLVAIEATVAELVLRGVDREHAERTAALCFGAIGWAIEAADDNKVIAKREEIQSELIHWQSDSLQERLGAAGRLAGTGGKPDKIRGQAIEFLEIMMTWWRTVLLAGSGEIGPASLSSAPAAMPTAAKRESPAMALHAIRAIAIAITRINQNVDTRLTLEALAIAL